MNVQAERIHDLTSLENLSNEIILDVIQRRYQVNQFYTYVGDILLAVNPCSGQNIYTQKHHERYKDLVAKHHADPHVFWIAETAHRNLCHTEEKQCIVVSGESGAGKTESTKYVLQHLLSRSECSMPDLMQKLENINPVVELFGNATTELNENSSRFGKMIELCYGHEGQLIGGKLEAFVLEKSRIVNHGIGEKNFHIFYALFAGMDEHELSQYYFLETPSTYRILQSQMTSSRSTASYQIVDLFRNVDERSNYQQKYKEGELMLRNLGYTNQEIHNIRQILAAILHLGNIEFGEDDTAEGLMMADESHVLHAIQMLGFDDEVAESMKSSLTTSVIIARNEKVQRSKSLAQADEERDGLIKELYNVLFTAVVSKISDNLKPKQRSQCSIGLLDISGFENFPDGNKNRFEQLLINITNERLHQYFQKQMFKAEEEDLIREGVSLQNVQYSFSGNIDVLSLIFDSPGILSVLEDEMVVPMATDASLVKKYNDVLNKSSSFVPVRGRVLFGINHFAGKVVYNADGFLQKNKGNVSLSLMECVRKSPNSILTQNLDKTRSIGSSRAISQKTGKIHNSVVKQYKKSLDSMNDMLTQGRPQFIRCIKPNKDLREGVFDSSYASTQLRSNGVLEVSRVRRDGFPIRFRYQQFIKRYKNYMNELKVPITTDVETCKTIVGLTTLKLNQQVLLGKSKIFLKANGIDLIDSELKGKMKELHHKRDAEEKERERKVQERRIRKSSIRSNTSQKSMNNGKSKEYEKQETPRSNVNIMDEPIISDKKPGDTASENSSFSTPPPYEDVVDQNETPLYDIFRTTEREEVGCEYSERMCLRLSRLVLYILLFSVVLFCGTGCLLGILAMCSEFNLKDEGIKTKIQTELFMVFGIPLGLQWCISLMKTCFGLTGKIKVHILFMVFVIENSHVCGTTILLFKVIPSLGSIWGLIAITGCAFVPSLLNFIKQICVSRTLHRKLLVRIVAISLAFVAIGVQSVLMLILCYDDFLKEAKPFTFSSWRDVLLTAFGLVLVSLGWSECFIVSDVFCIPFLQWKKVIQRTREQMNIVIIISKCAIFFVTAGVLASSFKLGIYLPNNRDFRFKSQEWFNAVTSLNDNDRFNICVTTLFTDYSYSVFSMQSDTSNISFNSINETFLDTTPTQNNVYLPIQGTIVINHDSFIECNLFVYSEKQNSTVMRKERFNIFTRTCLIQNRTLRQTFLTNNDEIPILDRYCKQDAGNIFQNFGLLFLLCILPLILAYSACVACRIQMQRMSFSLALVLVPVLSFLLLNQICQYEGMYLEGSFTCSRDKPTSELSWTLAISLTSCLSIALMSGHVWWPSSEVMAKADRLFVLPLLDGFFTPLSLLFRRRDDNVEIHLGRKHRHHKTSERRKERDRPLVYVCATMWHETKEEMTQLLKSLFRLDYYHSQCQLAEKEFKVKVDYFNVEVHVIFDDAFITDPTTKQRIPNKWVKQLVNCIDNAAKSVAKGNIHWDKTPIKNVTPYGGRLNWKMPGGTAMTFHLKDKNKIRHRKRWSQVMYLYYLLGFKFTETRNENEFYDHRRRNRWRRRHTTLLNNFDHKTYLKVLNTFILTLDGDTDFKPEALKLLLDRMAKNEKVGAVCGRIHPIGAGPMVWYQRFEYSLGHWLQKAAEHVFGCVLCCPGCFSLFRAGALMDDNVMNMYTTPPSEAKHYIQFEQGEDRWLCTLLLQQGWKIEYCAGADAQTFSPETLKDFFVQRRRWAPSTLANMIDLVSSWMTTVNTNANISSLFMFYQFVLLASGLLGPALVTLMIAGSYSAVFRISDWYGLLLAILPVIFYIYICIKKNNDVQIMIAGLLSSVYAVVMVIVTVGTLLNALSEPLYSPNVVLPMILGFVFVTAGLLHPKEIMNVIYGVLYYLTVPSTFVFMTVYYLCNIHNVTWGTREESKPLRQATDDSEPNNREDRSTKKGILGKIVQILGKSKLSKDISALIKRTLNTETVDDTCKGNTIKNTTNRDLPIRLPVRVLPVQEYDNSLPIPEPMSPMTMEDNSTWASADYLGNKELVDIGCKETTFWNYVISKYLAPIDNNEEEKNRITKELVSLRNNVVFGFFLINLLFTILVFQLQINKDSLRKFFLLGEYEPVSLLFILVFVLILLVQYSGMIIHRWGTYQHLIANTNLGICGTLSSDKSYSELALKEAGKLQSASSDLESATVTAEESVSSLDGDYPAEDYSDNEEDPPDYDSHSPDYSDDDIDDIQVPNAYARNFQQRFNARQQIISQDYQNQFRRHIFNSRPVTTHDLYNRTIGRRNHHDQRRGYNYDHTEHNQYGRRVDHI